MPQEKLSQVRRLSLIECPDPDISVSIKDYQRTSLRPYVELFEKHINAVMRDNREAKKIDHNEKVTMDF
jgi:DNA primase small subunit